MKKIIIISLSIFSFLSVLFFSSVVNASQCVAPTTPVCYNTATSEQPVGQDMYGTYIQTTEKQVQVSCSGTQKEIDYEANILTYNVCVKSQASQGGLDTSNTSSQSTVNDIVSLSSCPNPYNYTQSSSLPKDGMQKAYNIVTGEREDQPTGQLSEMYSTYDPINRTDVVDTINDSYGDTLKKFSDGTYGFFNSTLDLYSHITAGTYQTAGLANLLPNMYLTTVNQIKSTICKMRITAQAKKDTPVNPNLSCTHPYGSNSIIDPTNSNNCICANGYQWSSDGKSCVIKIVSSSISVVVPSVSNISTTTNKLPEGCTTNTGFSSTIGVSCYTGETNLIISSASNLQSTQDFTKISFSRLLKYSMKGDDVKLLQQALIKLGYLSTTQQVSTTFGKLTQNAVIKFQKDNNVKPASGSFGPATQKIFIQKLKTLTS